MTDRRDFLRFLLAAGALAGAVDAPDPGRPKQETAGLFLTVGPLLKEGEELRPRGSTPPTASATTSR